MKTSNDIYDFTQPSKLGLIGYECFQNKTTKLFYFHFNDSHGKVLLYSQGYQTMQGRDNGIKALSLNRNESSQYQMKEENGMHYFTVIAKNNQEIGRSRNFENKELMLDEMQYLKDFNYEDIEEKHVVYGEDTLSEVYQDETPLSKNTFRLYVYKNSMSDHLFGKIEHLISKKKKNFKKIDGEELIGFIKDCIHTDGANMPSSMIEFNKETNEENKAEEIIIQFSEVENFNTEKEILESDELWSKLVADNFNMRITIPSKQKMIKKPVKIQLENLDISSVDQNYYSASLDISSVDKHNHLYNLQFSNAIPTNGDLEFDIPIHTLPKGMYRLHAELHLGNSNELSNKKGITIKGSQLFQIWM